MFADELRDHLTALQVALERLQATGVTDGEAGAWDDLFADLERIAAAGRALVGLAVQPEAERWPASVGCETPPGREAPVGCETSLPVASLGCEASAGSEPSAGSEAWPGPESAAGCDPPPGPEPSVGCDISPGPEPSVGCQSPPSSVESGDPAWWPGSADPSERFAHDHRHLRVTRDPRGGVRGSFWVTEESWARVSPRLETHAERSFRAARCSGYFESHEQYMADALVALLVSQVAPSEDTAAAPSGAGPTAVVGAAPRALLGSPPAFPPLVCVVPSCGSPGALERHRPPGALAPPAAGGDTGAGRGGSGNESPPSPCPGEEELVALCTVHHDQVIYRGWHLHRSQSGWEWHSPSHCSRRAEATARAPARE